MLGQSASNYLDIRQPTLMSLISICMTCNDRESLNHAQVPGLQILFWLRNMMEPCAAALTTDGSTVAPLVMPTLCRVRICVWMPLSDRAGLLVVIFVPPFHQVKLDPDSADKTAFITRRGMFRYRTMPFGLTNAVATFQRLMDLVLSGVSLDICIAYLDDTIIHSATLEQHLQNVELILQKLQGANLKLKPSKCFFLQTSVKFLKHIVSAKGLQTDPEKTRLIDDWHVPTSLKQLRAFLGIAEYYRRFLKGFSKKAAPLNDLLKKGHNYQWTPACQSAFQELKDALRSPPILALPDDTGVFYLDTDASDKSIGAVLSQMQDGQEKVMAYAGRALNKNELNYCAFRKELLVVVYFTKHFKQYLLSRFFYLRSDNSA